ncbi:MAG: tellurite resistance TerB family protein [Litorimonas sp.]
MTDTPKRSKNSPQDLLSQLLGGGFNLTGRSGDLTKQARELGQRGENFLIDKLDLDDSDASRDQIRQQAKYAGIAGGLALLLSSRSTRKLATIGGLAALGAVAYKGHKRGAMPTDFKDAINLLTGNASDRRATMLLRAMIAAAKADGVIDDEERALIEAYPDADLDQLSQFLAEPDHPADIAALATSDQCGAEIYAVSCRIADGTNMVERDYLDRLAMALRLDPEAAALIETEVRTG